MNDKSTVGCKPFGDKFKLNVKGRGKSRKSKMELAEFSLSQATIDEDVIIVDPDAYYYN